MKPEPNVIDDLSLAQVTGGVVGLSPTDEKKLLPWQRQLSTAANVMGCVNEIHGTQSPAEGACTNLLPEARAALRASASSTKE